MTTDRVSEGYAGLLALFRSLNSNNSSRTLAGLSPEAAQWILSRLIETSALGPVLHGAGGRIEGPLGEMLEGVRLRQIAAVLEQNSRILKRTARVSAILDEAGIASLSLKGPLRQEQVYGTRFVRSSKDVDMLVRSRDFAAALAVLDRAGFDILHDDDMHFWWRRFAGQHHLGHRDDPGWSIDLHHRLQAPDAEQPRHVEGFFDRAERSLVEGHAVQLPCRDHARLVAAANIVKALHRRRASVGADWRTNTIVHVCDLATELSGEPDGRARFLDQGRRHGLSGTTRLALRVVDAIFGAEPGGRTQDDILASVPDEALRRMVLLPDRAEIWPKPWQLLAALCRPDRAKLARHLLWYGNSAAVRVSVTRYRDLRRRLGTS